jgi:hypothetical protein
MHARAARRVDGAALADQLLVVQRLQLLVQAVEQFHRQPAITC